MTSDRQLHSADDSGAQRLKPFDDSYLLREGWELKTSHPYANADGVLLFEKMRYERPNPGSSKGYEKKLLYRHRNGNGELFWGAGTDERPLYRLQNILTADPDEEVILC